MAMRKQVPLLEETPLPPLSQSRQAAMACSAFYAARYIHEAPDFESEPARRGSEIHKAIAEYVQHLAKTRQATDYTFIRALASSASEESTDILDGFVESFIFDPEKVLAVEWLIQLNSDFSPCEDRLPAFEGTLDLVTMESETEATIWDWKSYFAIVDADTFQSKLYPLLLFSLNPALEKVRFVLQFVRYGSASREVTYTRGDVPKLRQIAENERARQAKLHELVLRGEEPTAAPGRHCSWCSLLQSGCPMERVNPYTKLTPEKRLMQTVWLKQAYEASLAVMRDLVVEGGPVECRDDNGSLLRADFRPKMMHSYPLGKALPVLQEWRASHPGDGYMIEGLTVGGLSSPLKAKKREQLAVRMGAICEERCQTELKVGPAKDSDD